MQTWIDTLSDYCEQWQAEERVHQSPPKLLDWETAARCEVERWGPLNQRALGIRPIELHRIVGTVGRADEFDGSYYPCTDDGSVGDRFKPVFEAMKAGASVAPITAYKLRQVYYVEDGNHRVGAAKRLGWDSLDGDVTCFLPSGDAEEVQLFHQRREFEAATELVLIEAACAGTYTALLSEIEAYRQAEAVADDQVSLPTVAGRWYYRVFCPALAVIRGSRIRRLAPSLSSADILAALLVKERGQATARQP